MTEILQLASSFSLGLLIGSLLTEAFILVPYWRTMDAKEFLRLHGTLGPSLYRYFAPLTIIATILPVLAAIVPVMLGEPMLGKPMLGKPMLGEPWTALSMVPGAITLTMLALYMLYFKGANESFETGSVGVDGVAQELQNWAKWHNVRVSLGLIAFLVSLIVLCK